MPTLVVTAEVELQRLLQIINGSSPWSETQFESCGTKGNNIRQHNTSHYSANR